MSNKIGIIGAGSWGTALAKLLADKGENVVLWSFEKEVTETINSEHRNPFYLSDIKLPHNLYATNDLDRAIIDSKFVFSVVPSKFVRDVWTKASKFINKSTILISATKGIEIKTLKLISEILDECLVKHLEQNRVYLSGPSFAPEVAKGLPTSVVIAGINSKVREVVQNLLRTDRFLTFTHDDVVGIEISGAVKNVIAIAAGMSDGLGFGNNARAAIITRGLYEMIKIGKTFGANPLTFVGLAGIGDLVLTCTGDLSRNHTIGKELGQGKSLEMILSNMKMEAEGIPTSKAVFHIIKKYNINAPICESVYKMLYENFSPEQAAKWLCSLPLKEELRSILD